MVCTCLCACVYVCIALHTFREEDLMGPYSKGCVHQEHCGSADFDP